jgi:hypothetical protein
VNWCDFTVADLRSARVTFSSSFAEHCDPVLAACGAS